MRRGILQRGGAVATETKTTSKSAKTITIKKGARITGAARDKLAADPGKAPTPPDLDHPSMRSWLDELPEGHGRAAAFETRIWWSPRGATAAIDRGLRRAGYQKASKAEKFVVEGTYGPLREGELDRARRWGMALAQEITA